MDINDENVFEYSDFVEVLEIIELEMDVFKERIDNFYFFEILDEECENVEYLIKCFNWRIWNFIKEYYRFVSLSCLMVVYVRFIKGEIVLSMKGLVLLFFVLKVVKVVLI